VQHRKKRPDRIARAGAAAILVASILSASDVRADARSVAARVAEEWRTLGAETTVLPTRFVFDEETVVIPFTPPPLRADVDEAKGTAHCVHIAIIGARGLSFRAKLSDAPTDPLLAPEPNARASSGAGVLELRRCDPARPEIRHVVLTTEAGRGAVEVVVATAPLVLPALGSIIPERTGGVIPAPPEAGPLPPVVAQDKRAEAAELRARREGAVVAPRTITRAADDGGGEEDLDLPAGCHRIEVFGREGEAARDGFGRGRRFRLDVDAELHDGEHIIARDRTEAPDARLETCVGSPSRLTLTFAGAPPRSDLIVTRGAWPLPARLPAMWGSAPRSKMARVMFVRHVAVPPDDPVYLAQGSSGSTPLPLSVETGACYVAVVGVVRGRARQLQLRAFVGARESTDERGGAEEAALSTFCVKAEESAHLEVFARGSGLSWGLALFRVKSGVWEPGR
jgi:hypothetical protein